MTAAGIEIVRYDPTWPDQFRTLGARLRGLLGTAALRIDHIGSTAVPGLVAKDVIDVQITLAALADDVLGSLEDGGFVRRAVERDHAPRGVAVPAAGLEKRFLNEPPGERRVNVHVRVAGRFNQRYALLCRDYLRAHPLAAGSYGQLKIGLARIVGADVEAYYEVKDPVFDILVTAADEWAEHVGWAPGPSDA